ncbi:MAG: methionine adenosyltransferase domain-containing protein [Acidobacteria bacterium]|nr:methionine adenosyltransferase domain-containing protein [Acidobacteriota bacterium]
MIRTSEAVLDGHTDKFCDILADAIIAEGYKADPGCYAQIEAGVWSDAIWLSGVMVTRKPIRKTVEQIVREVGNRIGYTADNHIDAGKYRVLNEICFIQDDPRPYTAVIHDQSIVIGWAGYDRKTNFLPPEQFLVHELRRDVIASLKNGPLDGEGPDGKFLVILRETGGEFILEEVVVTLQHRRTTGLRELRAGAEKVFAASYAKIRQGDSRWAAEWGAVRILVNPNGELIAGGSDGDNGQTGRKLVMDHYGPRVPIGGGALAGKDFAHIDRLGAYAARNAAVKAVESGAAECKITLVYAPGKNEPLDVIYDMSGSGKVFGKERFGYERMKKNTLMFRPN